MVSTRSVDESMSLNGNVLMHPSFVTPYRVPVFVRATILRVVSGSLLLSGIFVGCVALALNDVASMKTRLSCSLSCATSLVAFYHYQKLLSIREQGGTRVTLSKPGDVPMGQAVELKLSWQELAADAVRYSDWLVTLTPLIVDLHVMADLHVSLFPVAWSPILCSIMVLLGSFTRIGTDELVPPSGETTGHDMFVRIAGVAAFCLSSVCLFFVLYNLLHDLNPDPSHGWCGAFSLPWIGYGLVTIVSFVWRQIEPEGYPEALSVFKDVAFGALDTWSKAMFGIYIGTSALKNEDLMFVF